MTIWSDYQTTPGDNNSAPPVGAPEGMAPSAVDDTMREMMSVVRQLGDEVITNGLAMLGTMADQNANNVAITGGTVIAALGGDGGGVFDLQSGYLVGQIPQACLNGGSYNISVAHASDADTLGGINVNALVPIGAIIMFNGNLSTVSSANWALCDGTRGTPDLRNRFIIGAGSNYAIGQQGGGTQTSTAGAHSHGGSSAPYALQIADLPYHDHGITSGSDVMVYGSGGNAYMQGSGPLPVTWPEFWGQGADNPHSHGISTDGGHAHNQSIPPYYGLYYIMRVA